jgi:hypothetical protein
MSNVVDDARVSLANRLALIAGRIRPTDPPSGGYPSRCSRSGTAWSCRSRDRLAAGAGSATLQRNGCTPPCDVQPFL